MINRNDQLHHSSNLTLVIKTFDGCFSIALTIVDLELHVSQ